MLLKLRWNSFKPKNPPSSSLGSSSHDVLITEYVMPTKLIPKMPMVVMATRAGWNSKFLYVAKYQKVTKAPIPKNKGTPTNANMRSPMRWATFSGMAAGSSFTCSSAWIISRILCNSAFFSSAFFRRSSFNATWPGLDCDSFGCCDCNCCDIVDCCDCCSDDNDSELTTVFDGDCCCSGCCFFFLGCDAGGVVLPKPFLTAAKLRKFCLFLDAPACCRMLVASCPAENPFTSKVFGQQQEQSRTVSRKTAVVHRGD
mmetsp:Transcript_8532/g.11259  ORF Transcript_8532/g.11259 Transcript_8532/m.11259 type:complete len:256 (-) Transcript_8532:120-887(-)